VPARASIQLPSLEGARRASVPAAELPVRRASIAAVEILSARRASGPARTFVTPLSQLAHLQPVVRPSDLLRTQAQGSASLDSGGCPKVANAAAETSPFTSRPLAGCLRLSARLALAAAGRPHLSPIQPLAGSCGRDQPTSTPA
jgi:hypothetical protein